jgi:hypothetical protein
MRQCCILTHRWLFPQHYSLLLQLYVPELTHSHQIAKVSVFFSLQSTSRTDSAPATPTMALNFDKPIMPLSAVLSCSSCLATSWIHAHCSTCIEGETNEQRKEGMPEVRWPEQSDCKFLNGRLLSPCLEAHQAPRLFIRY